ncbi:MAG TPA: hypothetical protein VJ978_00260, partial [Nitriliruptoraceae bacterium]|nr:hypothetical protein [Nitriliruptoraceae bacterium]
MTSYLRLHFMPFQYVPVNWTNPDEVKGIGSTMWKSIGMGTRLTVGIAAINPDDVRILDEIPSSMRTPPPLAAVLWQRAHSR